MVGQEAGGHVVQRAAGGDAVHAVPGDGQPGVGVQLRAVQGQQLGAVLLRQLPNLRGSDASAGLQLLQGSCCLGAMSSRQGKAVPRQAWTSLPDQGGEPDSRGTAPGLSGVVVSGGWTAQSAQRAGFSGVQLLLCWIQRLSAAITRWQPSARPHWLEVPETGVRTASPTLKALGKVEESACCPLQPLA